MARAHYLHVITDPTKIGFDAIVGIFTVKHEMETFIERRQLDMDELTYTRTVDGKYLPIPRGCSRCGDPDPQCICYAR